MAHGWPPDLVHVMAMELEHAPGRQGVVAPGMGADLSLGISVMGLDGPSLGHRVAAGASWPPISFA